MLMIWLYIWIEWLFVIDDEFVCQKLCMWVCYVFVENWWRMKLWLLNYEWIHDYLLLMLFWNMLLMNWYNGYPYLWIGDENCCCVENCESLVNCWILMKWCFNLKFYASLSVFSCIWPVNIIWNEFWVGKYQNWNFWGKGVWNSIFFYWTDERAPSEL